MTPDKRSEGMELVLQSKRPGATQWSIRNRCSQEQATLSLYYLRRKLEVMMNSWASAEPETQFRLKWIPKEERSAIKPPPPITDAEERRQVIYGGKRHV